MMSRFLWSFSRFSFRPLAAAAVWSGVMMTGQAVHAEPLELQTFVSGLDYPVYMQTLPGDDRMFIAGLDGVIRIYQDGAVLPTPFIDLSSVVSFGAGEDGLHSFVFDPDFANNGRVFIHYSENPGSGLRSTFASYTLSSPNTLDPNSRQIVISFTHPHTSHYGGWMDFGPDGYLWITTGDGGHSNDSGTGHSADTGNAQDLTSNPYGKILRLDISGDQFPEAENYNYIIPEDNPFADGGGDPEIFAYGLRNVFRASFDPLTGDLYLGDVGQGDREEINFIPAGSPGGQNFGWRKYEGTALSGVGVTPDYSFASTVAPVIEYDHDDQRRGRGSVTGGVVYRGSEHPDWYGYYFFADFVNGDVWAVDTADLALGSTLQEEDLIHFPELTLGNDSIVAINTDNDGELYILDINGTIYKVVSAPTLTGDANNDGVVNGDDFLAVEEYFGQTGPTTGWLLGDANDDGRVDGADLLAVERYFGDTDGIFDTPEPTTAAMLLGGLVLLRRRRA